MPQYPCVGTAHREELIFQAQAKLEAVINQPTGIIKAGHRAAYDLPIQVGSVQSVVNRLNKMPAPGLIIVDEAHHATAGSYRKVLEQYPDTYQLGVTATPTRLDGRGFVDIFDSLVCGPSVSELIEWGYLSDFKLYASPDAMKTSGVHIRQGDYNIKELSECNDAVTLAGNLIHSYLDKAAGKQCVVFAINVEHSKAIAERYRAAGIEALHLDGDTDSDYRRESLRKFANREIQVLTNCALFDEGLDIPGIEVIQCAKPTASLVRWLQMCGRALRPAPGKDKAIILDHTNNWALHGTPKRPRVWMLEGVESSKSSQAFAFEDGEVIEVPEIVEAETDLQPVDDPEPDQYWNSMLNELLQIQQSRGYKKGWIQYQLEKLKPPLETWYRAAELLGYRRGWGWHKWLTLSHQTGDTRAA